MGIRADEHHILVNERKVDRDYQLRDGDVVKVLPVVYGGSFAGPVDAGHIHGQEHLDVA